MPSLAETLRTKLIPWSQQKAGERFIIARRKMRQADMPYGVQLVPHQIQSERVIVKNKRSYNNVRNVIAEWPDAGLHELGKHVIVCVLEGYVDYALGDYKMRCGPGHFIFIPRGIPHPNGKRSYVDLEKGTSCDIAVFLLHPNALECWMSHSEPQKRVHIGNCLVLQEYVVLLLQALTTEVAGEDSEKLRISEKLLNLFLELLLREIKAERFQAINSTVQAKEKIVSSADFLTYLERYVQINLRKPLTLDAVSMEMHYSPRHFTRVMRRETGKSFNEYVAEQRIKEAKVLLCNTDWTITAVASQVGFNSLSYFRTFFRQHAGMTPTAFRLESASKKTTREV